MVVVILASCRALEKQEQKYGRLLARYVAVKEPRPEFPEWANSAGERYCRYSKAIDGLRKAHNEDTKGE